MPDRMPLERNPIVRILGETSSRLLRAVRRGQSATSVIFYTRTRARGRAHTRRHSARAGTRRLAVVLILSLAFIAGLGLTILRPAQTAAAANSTINFQARLETAAGAIVPDGNYNVEFKLYQGGTATGGGTLKWTEDYLNSASQGIQVANGYLTANLGAITPFPAGISWDQQLYLTMNIGGTGSGSFPGIGDGEMNPRLLITALPYAFRAGQLADPGSSGSTLGWASQTAARSILLPDEAGTLCIQNSTNCGFATTSGSGNYIQNQTASPQAAGFNISGAGSLGGLLTGTAGAAINGAAINLNVASNFATNINTGSSTGTITLGGGSAPLVINSTHFDVSSGGALSGITGFTQASGNTTFNQNAANELKVVALQAPTTDMANISNAGFPTTTAGVNGLQIDYYGGSAAVESGALRVNITPGGTSGGTWDALHLFGGTAAAGVTENGIKLDNITGGAGTENALNIGTGWDNILQATNLTITQAGNITAGGDVQVQGGDLTTNQTVFNLINTTATTLNIGGAVGAGGINLAGGSGSTGCTIDGSTGNLACSGSMTSTATSGQQGWWTRTGTYLQPATTGDNVQVTNASSGATIGFLNSGSSTYVSSVASASSSWSLATQVSGDANRRFVIYADGELDWGDGTNPQDTYLYRSGAGTLQTDGSLSVGNTVYAQHRVSVEESSDNGTRAALDINAGGTGVGGLLFGDGTGTTDTNLYRSAAATLNTDGNLVVGTVGTSHGLTINGLLGAATFGTDGNGLYFSRPSSNYIEANTATGTLRLGAGGNSNNIVLNTDGSVLFQNAADSTTAFKIQNAPSDTVQNTVFTADTQNSRINISGDTNIGNFGNRLFSDNFESGNFRLWNASFSGSSITTSTVHDGAYAAQINPVNNNSFLSTHIAANPTVYERSWVNVSSQTSSTALLMEPWGDIGGGNCFMLQRTTTGALQIYNCQTGLTSPPTAANTLPIGSWHQVEMRVTIGSSTGVTQVWVDGVQVINLTGQSNSAVNIDGIQVGSDLGTDTYTAYFDDVSADTQSTGTASSLNVGDSLHVGGDSTFGSNLLVNQGSNIYLGTNASIGENSSTNLVLSETSGGTYIQSHILQFQDNYNSYANEFTIQNGGQTTFQNAQDSPNAFKIQNAAGTNLLNIDSAEQQALLNSSLIVSSASTGNSGGVAGGTGSGATGDEGGGGGGAVGGVNAAAGGGGAGITGAQSADVSGLFSVLSGLGVSTTSPGAGNATGGTYCVPENGGAATGFGDGGGGANWFGGNGGAGRYGGGGGGASGGSGCSSYSGGAGGQGVVVISPTGAANQFKTSGTTYTVPAGVNTLKIWVIGAGGGGAGVPGGDGFSGGAGGAGGVAYRTFSVIPGQTITYSLGTPGTGGSGAANGVSGGSTSVMVGAVTVTASGGAGGLYNNNTTSTGGNFSGGDTVPLDVQNSSGTSVLSVDTTTSAVTVTGSAPIFTPNSHTYNYTGSSQTFTVPAGVTSINVTLYGAQGGTGYGGGAGGAGGQTTGTISVSPGQVLTIIVGGQGSNGGGAGTSASGGYGGGGSTGASGAGYSTSGGGGGMSAITSGATYLAIAGGGGGGATAYAYIGGIGGGLTGGTSSGSGRDGGGGTQAAGGTITTAGVCDTIPPTVGSAYQGGSGGSGPGYSGGGGGGGYYGGGGGDCATASGIGTGGGGSALVPSGGTTTSGVQSGNGQVAITWADPTVAPPAFQVQDTGGNTLFTVNTADNELIVGTPSAAPTLLILGAKNTLGDPTCINGGMYYNSSSNQAKVCLGGSWAAMGVPTVTTLPSSPADGDEVYYRIDRGDGTYGYWHLRYNASTTYWDFLGGPAIYAYGSSVYNTSSTTWVNPTNNDRIILPLNGDYDITFGTPVAQNLGAGLNEMGVGAGYSATCSSYVPVSAIGNIAGSQYAGGEISYTSRQTNLAQNGCVLDMIVSYQGLSSNFGGITNSITPIRVK